MSSSQAPFVDRGDRARNFQELIRRLSAKEIDAPAAMTRLYQELTAQIEVRQQRMTNLENANTGLRNQINLAAGRDISVSTITVDRDNVFVKSRVNSISLQRPSTSQTNTTVMDARSHVDVVRADQAYHISLPVNMAKLQLITPDHAKLLLNERQARDAGPLGCLLPKTLPAAGDYPFVNLLHTKSRVAGHTHENIGIAKMYMHHLALIAADDIEHLSWCTQKDPVFQVSHLCHNRNCFNISHLAVEEATLNRARNICQHHEVVLFKNQVKYNPCPHAGAKREYKSCILPLRQINESGNYTNNRNNWTPSNN